PDDVDDGKHDSLLGRGPAGLTVLDDRTRWFSPTEGASPTKAAKLVSVVLRSTAAIFRSRFRGKGRQSGRSVDYAALKPRCHAMKILRAWRNQQGHRHT